MAFDGIVIAGLVHELNQTILNTKISKIAQPENDELLLTCKGSSGQFRVSISANASLPFLYLTDTNKTSPLQAPTFCMVLRKHIANGRIISITQPHMERIIHLKIEHLNEMAFRAEAEIIGNVNTGVIGEFQHIPGSFDPLFCDVSRYSQSDFLMKQL